jgi:hypothetical protein
MMSTSEILDKINQLSPSEKLFIIEKTFKDLLRSNAVQQMTVASEALEHKYRTNSELTAFTSIDLEDFYEAK